MVCYGVATKIYECYSIATEYPQVLCSTMQRGHVYTTTSNYGVSIVLLWHLNFS
jgi:hypothetical protein